MNETQTTNRLLADHGDPEPPHYLVAKDVFAQRGPVEVFIKKIWSERPGLKRQGPVIMAPGVATNSLIFRTTVRGDSLALNHASSFANLLAAKGFTVYLYNPGYCERVYNRYVVRHCPDSIHYGAPWQMRPFMTFYSMVDEELKPLVDFVTEDSGHEEVSWVGYSMGGMLVYAYLAVHGDRRIRDVVTIASPVSFSEVLHRLFFAFNLLSTLLGFEERHLMGSVMQNLVPITRGIAHLPRWLLRYNMIFSPALYDLGNIHSSAVRSIFGRIVEPLPRGLERSFTHFYRRGFTSRSGTVDYLRNLMVLGPDAPAFLFFMGTHDLVAPAQSIRKAHEALSRGQSDNLIVVTGAGHLDIVLGKRAVNTVWMPTLDWLLDRWKDRALHHDS